jgi:hypothetical protein
MSTPESFASPAIEWVDPAGVQVSYPSLSRAKCAVPFEFRETDREQGYRRVVGHAHQRTTPGDPPKPLFGPTV